MATLAPQQVSAPQGWQPLLAHPLMATAVPVWFAVTFALSSLAVRGSLIEQFVLASHLDLFLPMATPPLGNTARFLVAALFAMLGAGIGMIVARLMKPAPRKSAANTAFRPNEPSPVPMERIRLRETSVPLDAPMREPIRAHAELGPHGFDHMPLAEAPDADKMPSFIPPPIPQEPLAPLHEIAPPPLPVPDNGMEQAAGAPAPVLQDAWLESDAPLSQPVAESTPTSPAGFLLPSIDGPSAADHIATAPVDQLSHIELIERLAIAMQRRREADSAMMAESPSSHIPLAPAPDGTGEALRAALSALREVK